MAEKQNLETTNKETKELLGNQEYDLSDFALFLAVMKIPQAYRNVLSITMDEPDIELLEVKVEEVVLNKSGKRAIRLDAWAKSTDNRQFNMEMQNDTEKDDVRKRSRYYQGMIDSPILKSGKETRYKHLPSTVIIFITQKDIFQKDRAKYTFTEQCEEVPGLPLEDGTKKIFLNMESKNGPKELIDMLSYMKDSNRNHHDVKLWDRRIFELDQIVQEVRSSEEWEETRMNIYQRGKQQGLELGRYHTLREMVEKKLQKGYTIPEIADMLEQDKEVIAALAKEIQNA